MLSVVRTPIDKLLVRSYIWEKVNFNSKTETWHVIKHVNLTHSLITKDGYTTKNTDGVTKLSTKAKLVTLHNLNFKLNDRIHDRENNELYIVKSMRRVQHPETDTFWVFELYLQLVNGGVNG